MAFELDRLEVIPIYGIGQLKRLTFEYHPWLNLSIERSVGEATAPSRSLSDMHDMHDRIQSFDDGIAMVLLSGLILQRESFAKVHIAFSFFVLCTEGN